MITNAHPAAKQVERKKQLPFVRVFIWIGIFAVLLIPSYIAISDYIIHKDSPAGNYAAQYVSVRLTGPTGHNSFAEPASDGLLELMEELVTGGERILAIPPDLEPAYTAEMVNETGTEHYTLYCNATSPNLYFDINGNCFSANEKTAEKFLNSSYAFELYTPSTTPTLTTAATDEIIPSQINWHYQTQNGKFTKRDAVTTTNEILLYPIANDIGFTFSIQPDRYTITVTENGLSKVYNNQGTFATPSLDVGQRISVTVDATYNEHEDRAFYGTITYKFQMNLVEAAQFSLNRTDLSFGDMAILTCKNIKNVGKLQISASPALNAAPVIFTKDDAVLALIPADAIGSRVLTVTYGTISGSFSLQIQQSSSAKELLLEESDLFGSLPHLLGEGLKSLIKEKGAPTSSGTLLPTGIFAALPNASAVRLSAFGDTVKIGGEYANTLPFEIYHAEGGIGALSFGVVRNTGTDQDLGKYIIIDHGCGLYTWYCGLSEIRAVQGQIVAEGDIIGIAGHSGFGINNSQGEPQNGVVVLATLGKTAVSLEQLRRTPLL